MEPAAICDDPVVVATGRVALWRAIVLVPLLALAFRWFTPRGPSGLLLPLFGACLGLVAAALTYPESIARRGRWTVGASWASVVGVVGVLWAAAQATFTDRALTLGATAAMSEVHAIMYLALYDPLTLPVVVLWAIALTLSLVTLVSPGRPWLWPVWPCLAVALAVGLERAGVFVDTPYLQVVLADPAEVSVGALPSGSSRGGPLPSWTASVADEARVVTILLAWLVPIGARVADALRGRFGARIEAAEVDTARATKGLASPLVLVLALEVGLAGLGRAVPLTGHVPWLFQHVRAIAPSACMRALRRIDPEDPAAVGALLAVADQSRGSDRVEVIELLRELGAAQPAVVSLLASSLSDTDRRVVYSALAAIAALGPRARAAGPALLEAEMLDDSPWYDTRRELRRVQGLVGFSPSTADLLRWCEHADPSVVSAALHRLASLPVVGAEALPMLGRHVTSDAWPLDGTEEAAVAFGKVGDQAIVILEGRIRSTEESQDRRLLRTLRFLPRDGRAMELLAAAVRHEDWGTRMAALDALWFGAGRDPWPDGVPLLFELLDSDPHSDVEEAIASYGARATVHLVERLRDPTRRVRALSVIRRAGLAAHATAPALVELLLSCPELREDVARAIEAVACPQNARTFLAAADASDPGVRGPLLLALGRGAADDAARARAWRGLDDPEPRAALDAALGLATSAAELGWWRPTPAEAEHLLGRLDALARLPELGDTLDRLDGLRAGLDDLRRR